MLRGAGKVGSALMITQGEQLRLMACNSTLGAGVQAAQGVVEGLVNTFMGGSNGVSVLTVFLLYTKSGFISSHGNCLTKLLLQPCCVCSNGP